MSHITVAVSEKAFQKLFEIMRDHLTIDPNNPISNKGDFMNLTIGYKVAFHLESGTVDLTDNAVEINGLKIVWDLFKIDLRAYMEICIPPVQICTVSWLPPFVEICLPQFCTPNFPIDLPTIDLSGITSEISMVAVPIVKYKIDPNRLPGMTDLDAEDASPPVPNKWELFIHPKIEDIDLPFDDITEVMLENLWKDAIKLAFPGWPDFWIDALLTILGPINDIIAKVIAIPMELNESLADLIGLDLGLKKTVINSVVDEFAKKTPIHSLEDPYPIMPAESGLIPVKIPIRQLTVKINEDEMVIGANVGAI
jgi:hypothetical protein